MSAEESSPPCKETRVRIREREGREKKKTPKAATANEKHSLSTQT